MSRSGSEPGVRSCARGSLIKKPVWISCLVALIVCLAAPAANAQQSLTCSSDNGKRNYCRADTRGGVRMVRQRSGSACVQGSTWGFDRGGVWVDRGCRADFVITGYRPGGPGPLPGPYPQRPGAGWNNARTVTCASEDFKRHYCNVDTRGGVRLARQRSGSVCRQGYSWGFDRRGIWVDRGCRADFLVR